MTNEEPVQDIRTLSNKAIELLKRDGLSIAIAESLTGGLLLSELVSIPGASQVLRGGIVAYQTQFKHELLGVDSELLAREGAVHPEVARQMAIGVRKRFATDSNLADIGVSTTGVAGPEPQDGKQPGTVFIGVSTKKGAMAKGFSLLGDRDRIRESSVRLALASLVETLELGLIGDLE